MTPTLGFTFPGQNSQHVGMLADVAVTRPEVLDTFAEASRILGYDLWHLVQNGSAEQLALTHITQPAILTSSIALWRVWQACGGRKPALMAGHSLGEYSALVCAGVLDFSDAVRLVQKRGEFMQTAVPVGTGTMAAIMGLEDAEVVRACNEVSDDGLGEQVAAANFNCPGQVVIAGHAGAVLKAMELCKAAGAKRALPLSVSAPFHSPLMEPAAERFAEELHQITLREPAIPVIQNYGLQGSHDIDEIRNNLIMQIFNPVPWVATIKIFVTRGITTLVELGPGKVLTGLNKRIDSALDVHAVNDSSSMNQVLQATASH